MALIMKQIVVVPMNPDESKENLETQLRTAKCKGIFVENDSLTGFLQDLGLSFEVMRIGNVYDKARKVSDEASYEMPKEERNEDLRMLVFTSGTTGRNKGVMLSMGSIFATIAQLMYLTNLGVTNPELGFVFHATKGLLVLPLYHVSGIAFFLFSLVKGMCVCICENPMYLYRDLDLMQPSFTFVVPAMLKSFYKDLCKNKRERLGALNMILCGGAPMDSAMLPVFAKEKIMVLQIYGLTETFGSGAVNLFHKPNTVGQVNPMFQASIIDGEICLKGACLAKGYYENEEDTKEVFVDGWFHTGDLGYIDEENYLYITGRKKNLIILSGGENVSPEELEGYIGGMDFVEEVICFEQKDKICAKVYMQGALTEEKKAALLEKIAKMNETLPGYKRIQRVDFSETPFEKTGIGKIKRK